MLELGETQQWSHAGLSWPLDDDLEPSMALRQRDSIVVAPMVPTVVVEIAQGMLVAGAPTAEEEASWVGSPSDALASAVVAATLGRGRDQ